MEQEQIEEYYQYIIEQLEFCRMITSIFNGEGIRITQKTSDKCRELANEIGKNVEHI